MSRPAYLANTIVIRQPVRAQMDGKPIDCVVHGCDMKDAHMSVGPCRIYECRRCGEEEERDYS